MYDDEADRGDKIRTCGLCVPNAALYQTEPRLDTFCSIIWIWKIVNIFLKKMCYIFEARVTVQGVSELLRPVYPREQ